MPSRPLAHDQRGFTLVEVLVAIFILLVGVLGVVTLVDGANAGTSKTKAREGGTNIARSVIEISRSIRYRDLTADELLAALQARPGTEDVKPGAGHTIKSRGVEYEVALTVCSLDDDKDNLGIHPAGITFCSDSQVGATVVDRNPDDYKRVRVTLVWSTRGTSQSITQTSSIINPVGGLGPSVLGLTTTAASSSNPIRIDSEISSASFQAITSIAAADVSWSVDGVVQPEKASGGPITWSFEWKFLNAAGNIARYDCTYVIQAEAVDEQGRSGAPYAATVILNRIVPLPVGNFVGGRNGTGNFVDLQWTTTPECDVVGYRVYRDVDPLFSDPQLVSCTGQGTASYTEETDCVDEGAPGGVVYYKIRGLDTMADGSLREGDWSSPVPVEASGENAVPSRPQNLSSCIGGEPGCADPSGTVAPSGSLVLRWDPSSDSDGSVEFYRIYRGGSSYLDRHDTFFADPDIAWIEPEPDGTYEYRVSAVDEDFGESDLSDPVTAGG